MHPRLSSIRMFWPFRVCCCCSRRTASRVCDASGSPRILHARSLPRPLRESVANIVAVDTDVSEIPVAETAQREKRCLTLAVSDHGGNPPVHDAAEARQKNRGCCPDSGRGCCVG